MYLFMFMAGSIFATLLLFGVSGWRRGKHRGKRRAGGVRSGRIYKGYRKKRIKIDTYVKAATTLVLLHGLTMVTMSYVLAWFEKDAVVDVSTTLITEIVAPLCLYMGTNCIMNIFEKNELSFSKPLKKDQDGTMEAVEDEAAG